MGESEEKERMRYWGRRKEFGNNRAKTDGQNGSRFDMRIENDCEMKRVQTKWENVKRHERLRWKERIVEMVMDGDSKKRERGRARVSLKDIKKSLQRGRDCNRDSGGEPENGREKEQIEARRGTN